MLQRLSVSNFAIINELNLSFGRGLTIITGETGAGKSILLGALRLILGERADLKQLNDQNKKCVVEAVFDISNLNLNSFFETNELDFENETIVRRELLPGGKSRAFVNDTPVNLNLLQSLSEKLIDIHSQFNSQNLFNQDYQLQILDAYVGQLNEIKSYRKLLNQRNQKRTELADLTEKLHELNKEADYRQFLFEELDTANLKDDEAENLEKEMNELKNVEEISRILDEAENKLNDGDFGILPTLRNISVQLQRISRLGKDFEEFYNRIESSRIELSDLNSEISIKLQKLEANPEKLEETASRLDLINGLLNKHRVQSIAELNEIKQQLETENLNSAQIENEIEELKKEISKLEEELNQSAAEISKNRKDVIPSVEKELIESVAKLGMENSAIELKLNSKPDFGPNGKDEIEFLFSANKGSQLKEIEKSVSGGERSRLMLAVKKLLAGKLELPTLILDEIDTGVSGRVADEVGNMMKEMSKNLQLITITHLPQVAAKADAHFKVEKQTEAEKTITSVNPLDKKQRILEIAALLSGSDITDSAIEQAELLISN
ncbi:MAG: DNA repair protein RecN [Flavobacteriia bacterium]|nr:DNA repair protein RecN [Flavobacteriia bacterium]